MMGRAGALRQKGNSAEAMGLLLEAVELARAASDTDQLANGLAKLGQVQRDLGKIDGALASYAESVAIARQAGTQNALAHRLRHLGDIHQDAGRLDDAEPFYAEALALYRANKSASVLDLANAVRPMALLREKQGRIAEAFDLWREASKLYELCGVEAGAVESRANRRRLERLRE